MRFASTYRGHRRNVARKMGGGLQEWRLLGRHADAANEKAKLHERAVMASEANKAVSLALVEAGPLASFTVATDAFLKFYTAPERSPRSRAVNRIIKGLRADARRKSI